MADEQGPLAPNREHHCVTGPARLEASPTAACPCRIASTTPSGVPTWETEPTSLQRLLADLFIERFRDYVAAERTEGRRYLGNTGTMHWLAALAPALPAELRAVLFGASSPHHLTEDRARELAKGIPTALTFYAELGFASYNLALYGRPEHVAGTESGRRARPRRCNAGPPTSPRSSGPSLFASRGLAGRRSTRNGAR
jgi:hypothetical protein